MKPIRTLRIPDAGERVTHPNSRFAQIVRCASADGVCLEITHGESAGYVSFHTLAEFHTTFVADTRALSRWTDHCRHHMTAYVGTVHVGGEIGDVYVYKPQYLYSDDHRYRDSICVRHGEEENCYTSARDIDALRGLAQPDTLLAAAVPLVEAALTKKEKKT